jgi:hypothetical protein
MDNGKEEGAQSNNIGSLKHYYLSFRLLFCSICHQSKTYFPKLLFFASKNPCHALSLDTKENIMEVVKNDYWRENKNNQKR